MTQWMNFDISHILSLVKYFFGISSLWNLLLIVIDISLVAYVVFRLVLLVKETRAWQLIKGILIIFFGAKISGYLGFKTLAYLMDHAVSYIAIALVVLFQPELRRALEQIGRSRFKELFNLDQSEELQNCSIIMNDIVDALLEMARTKTGALIVFERETRIGEIINSGVKLDSSINAKLLINIFTPNTPLHDGAVVIRDNKIVSASCLLPLSDNNNISKELGTRHRAGIGITEVSDAVAVIVSEETGRISIATRGQIQIGVDKQTLKEKLCQILIKRESEPFRINIWKGKNK